MMFFRIKITTLCKKKKNVPAIPLFLGHSVAFLRYGGPGDASVQPFCH